ncbi:Spo0B domain-containing protein [Paenibacillus sp. IB182496]|uniref:Spo0B domain-containing protein n=1 Tax=Paenibacillus sabuli TaxID=2772509 RepID=A0A927GR63_9BACL|nr:Spo0B domain-containing protein [Paenibacillus sabuli]MBD2844605.1 Spo0B domain-containing protein [Paenibacillus sabuli]
MRKMQIAAAASVLLPAATMLILHNSNWSAVVFALWMAAAAAIVFVLERRQQAQMLERALQALQQTSIRTLNHHRHDWMNDLQVLYGYIRMNKPDRMMQYVDNIRQRMAVDSKIGRLGEPSLVLFLQSFRTLTQSLRLEVEIEEDIDLTELPLDAAAVSASLIALIQAYRTGVKPGYGEPACLTLAMQRQEKILFVSLQFAGELLAAQQLHRHVQDKLERAPLRLLELDPAMTRVRLQADWQ